MTGQSILDLMEALNPELQLQTTEDDVTRGLLVLNAAQDAFESIVARYPRVLGSAISTVTTSASTESTAYPTGLLRLDALDYLDPSTSRPSWRLTPIQKVGGHAAYGYSPWNLLGSSTSSGKPRGYWTNGSHIYWQPLPDATHTVRWYGFVAASAITAAGTFAYPDVVALPLATFSVKVLKTGLDDDPSNVNELAKEIFEPLVESLSGFRREEGRPVNYHFRHDT